MSGRSSPNLLGGLQTVNTMSGFSSPQGATLSQTSMQSVSSAASQNNHITLNPINPLGFASHKDLKRLSEDLEREISNGHNVEPKAFISDDLKVLINTNVRFAKLDKDLLSNSQLQPQPQTLLSYKTSALLDSGAISANYMHKEVALKIAFLGKASIEKDSNVTCGAFINSCKKNFGIIKLTVNINDERTNNTYSFETVFKILENINYEVITGRPDIRLHDLTKTCRSQFYLPSEGILQVNQGEAKTTSIKKAQIHRE